MDREDALCKQVSILDYQNEDDFILALNVTSKNDRIILAKILPKATLQETIQFVEERIQSNALDEWMKELHMSESLKIPIIAFGLEKKYPELIDKWFLNPGWERLFIAEARQGIRFRLDERGARLESDASGEAACAMPEQPRHFVFDKPFLIYLKESSATAPYFAAWIGSAELLEPVED